MFLGLLPGRLLPILLRTVVLELNVARLRGLLLGESTEERFASFIARIQWPEVRLEFFREYPVWAGKLRSPWNNGWAVVSSFCTAGAGTGRSFVRSSLRWQIPVRSAASKVALETGTEVGERSGF